MVNNLQLEVFFTIHSSSDKNGICFVGYFRALPINRTC